MVTVERRKPAKPGNDFLKFNFVAFFSNMCHFVRQNILTTYLHFKSQTTELQCVFKSFTPGTQDFEPTIFLSKRGDAGHYAKSQGPKRFIFIVNLVFVA
jgi:hypothetical protein